MPNPIKVHPRAWGGPMLLGQQRAFHTFNPRAWDGGHAGTGSRAELRGGWRRAKFSVAGPIARRDDELTALPPTLAFRAALESAGVITAEDLIASNDL